MKRQMNWIVVMIIIFVLAGLACNAITGGGDEPTAVVDPGQPVATEAVNIGGEGSTGGESAVGDAPPTFNLNPENNFGIPADVNSYRVALDMQFEETKVDGTFETGHITATGAQVVEPFASTYNFTFEGSDVDLSLGGAGFSMTQIGDLTYVNLAGAGCVTTSGNDFDNPFSQFLGSESFLGGLQGATLVEENVTINGIQTDHYQFDGSSIPQEQQELGQLDAVDGHLYVARDGGYLVRLTMEADGQDLNLGTGDIETAEGHISYMIDYSDINQPIEITAPEGCSGESEYPMLPDATDVNAFGEILTYNTGTAFADAVAFYKTEMVAAGYTLESEFAAEPTALLSFAKDGETISVSVVDNPAGDGLTIVITKG